jgi:hypothetical protein
MGAAASEPSVQRGYWPPQEVVLATASEQAVTGDGQQARQAALAWSASVSSTAAVGRQGSQPPGWQQ